MKENKKTLLVATGLYPPEVGGPATYTKLIEERLPGHGFVVRVLPFRRVRAWPKILRHIAYFFLCLGYAAEADLVYAQDTLSVGLPAALAALVAGKKFVVRVPGDYAWEQARQRFGVGDSLDDFQNKIYGGRVELMRRIQRFVVRRARAVVAPSEYMRRLVAGWGVVPVRIYNGIDLPVPFEPPPQRPEGFLVVSLGRDVPWKGFDALRRVTGQEPAWHLKILSDMPRTQAMGWVKTADVFVNNSTYEGLSHQILEAMALGTPIVATDVGGNPELIGAGEEGLLIPAGDESALHAALQRVALDPGAAATRAAKAMRKVEDFSIDKTLDTLAGLLNSL